MTGSPVGRSEPDGDPTPGWGMGCSGGIDDWPAPTGSGVREPDDRGGRMLRRDHRVEQWIFIKGVLAVLVIALLVVIRILWLG